MRIGEVSKLVGISSSAIRFYERHGLINANNITRAGNGYRVYGRNDVEEIRLIVKFKEFGLELKDIKQLFSEESKSCGDLVSSLDEQLEKCREVERAIQSRIVALLAAKESCKFSCKPDRPVKKCCGRSVQT